MLLGIATGGVAATRREDGPRTEGRPCSTCTARRPPRLGRAARLGRQAAAEQPHSDNRGPGCGVNCSTVCFVVCSTWPTSRVQVALEVLQSTGGLPGLWSELLCCVRHCVLCCVSYQREQEGNTPLPAKQQQQQPSDNMRCRVNCSAVCCTVCSIVCSTVCAPMLLHSPPAGTTQRKAAFLEKGTVSEQRSLPLLAVLPPASTTQGEVLVKMMRPPLLCY